MVIETESYLTEEPSIEVQSGTEILESLGLKENDLWGKRVVIVGESNALKTVLQTSEHKIDFEFVSPKTIIAQYDQPDNPSQFSQKNSIDYIIDLGQNPTVDGETKLERYTIDEYKQMVEALHHNGRIVVPEPIKNRAFPIATRLARNFIIFFDPERQSNPALRLMRIENIVFTEASKRVGKDTSVNELWGEEFWWSVIEDLTTSEPPMLLERDVAEEFRDNLQSKLREDYEYKTQVDLTAQTKESPESGTLSIEKIDERARVTEEVVQKMANSLDIRDLSFAEMVLLRRISDLTMRAMKNERQWLDRPENRHIKPEGSILSASWEVITRFLGNAYGIDFGDSRWSIIAQKTNFGQSLEGSERVVEKYYKDDRIASKTFDVFLYPDIRAMRQAVEEYRNAREMGFEDQEGITTKVKYGVSDTLKRHIRDVREKLSNSDPLPK